MRKLWLLILLCGCDAMNAPTVPDNDKCAKYALVRGDSTQMIDASGRPTGVWSYQLVRVCVLHST